MCSSDLHFPVQVVAEDTRRKKPDPEVYAVALARLELSAAECVAFEDSRNGLLAARAAGIPVVITPSLYTDHERFDDALAVVSDLGGPEQPYRHIAGAGGNLTHVDLAALRTWLSAPEAAAR